MRTPLTPRVAPPRLQGKSDQTGMMSRREEARLQRFQRKNTAFVFDDEE